MSENIILIGFMGTGKDSVGRALAAKTGRVFLSTDRLIELQEHMSIAQMFAQQGEVFFRAKERDVIGRIKDLKHLIVATGGGAVLDENNRKVLKQMGEVICLTADRGVLEERLGSVSGRPLLTCSEDLGILLQARQGIYDFADYTFDTSDKEPGAVANEIMQKYSFPQNTFEVPTERVHIATGPTVYDVVVGSSLYPKIVSLLHQSPRTEQIVIITNPLVASLYSKHLTPLVKKNHLCVQEYLIPDGESHKTLKTITGIYDFLTTHSVTRDDLLIALGGGVVCDVTGFVASTYKRGTNLVHIPTTLLAQVDAAIGGKTGLDHAAGKNLIGTFYQPSAVLCDVTFLASLSEREYCNGLAEIIKYSLIEDVELFTFLKKNAAKIIARDVSCIADVIKRCVLIKGRIVGQDEREKKNIRQKLNFGHTIGHAIESLNGYKTISHGEAVAIGMVAEMKWAVKHGFLAHDTAADVTDLIASFNLPTVLPESISTGKIQSYVAQDKKICGGRIAVPVLTNIGVIEIQEVRCEDFSSCTGQI